MTTKFEEQEWRKESDKLMFASAVSVSRGGGMTPDYDLEKHDKRMAEAEYKYDQWADNFRPWKKIRREAKMNFKKII